MEQADFFIDIPVAAHIAPGCNGRKMIAPSAQLRLILQGEKGADVGDPGLLQPSSSREKKALTSVIPASFSQVFRISFAPRSLHESKASTPPGKCFAIA